MLHARLFHYSHRQVPLLVPWDSEVDWHWRKFDWVSSSPMSQSPRISISSVFCSVMLNHQEHQTMSHTNLTGWICLKRLVIQAGWMKSTHKMELSCRSKFYSQYLNFCLLAHKLIQNQVLPISEDLSIIGLRIPKDLSLSNSVPHKWYATFGKTFLTRSLQVVISHYRFGAPPINSSHIVQRRPRKCTWKKGKQQIWLLFCSSNKLSD